MSFRFEALGNEVGKIFTDFIQRFNFLNRIIEFSIFKLISCLLSFDMNSENHINLRS